MKSEVCLLRLGQGAVASTIASLVLMPHKHSILTQAKPPAAAVLAAPTPAVEASNQAQNTNSVHYTLRQMPTEWTEPMEREFRRLALLEAKGALANGQAIRLEELSLWRDRLVHPQPASEILLQLKRDRLIEKIAATLDEYVEFQEGAGKKRATA